MTNEMSGYTEDYMEIQFGHNPETQEKVLMLILTPPNCGEQTIIFRKPEILQLRDQLNEYLAWTMEQ